VILVDTSIWIDHLRAGNSTLASLLHEGLVCVHPFVVGELACGNLGNRREVLDLLHALSTLEAAAHEEVLFFIDQHRLMGRGIGYIDAHLLAATAIHTARLWTRDKQLKAIADELGLAYQPAPH